MHAPLLAFGLLGALCAAPAAAQEGGSSSADASAAQALLDGGRLAWDSLEYEQAAEELAQVMTTPGATDEQKLEASLLAGMCNAVLGNDTKARLNFIYVLSRDPDRALPLGTSPKIASFYELVRAEVATTKPETTASPPVEPAPTSSAPPPTAPQLVTPTSPAEEGLGLFVIAGGGVLLGGVALGILGALAAGFGEIVLATPTPGGAKAGARIAGWVGLGLIPVGMLVALGGSGLFVVGLLE